MKYLSLTEGPKEKWNEYQRTHYSDGEIKQPGQVECNVPVVPVTQEAEAEWLFESGTWRPAWAT